MSKSQEKTNAVRSLEAKKIPHSVHTYDISDNLLDGISVAKKVGKDPKTVYKTLVTQGVSGGYYIFVIPVEEELDFKKCAKACGEKKIDMIPVKDLLKVTGYVKGGCSPIGMKKLFPTFIQESCLALDTITVSAGKIGYQIEMSPQDMLRLIHGATGNYIK